MDDCSTIEEVQDAVRQRTRVRVCGGGSKPALSAAADISLKGLVGVLDYEPSEFVFTALAGTPVTAIESLLAEHGQFLPFDPPLVDSGATLGGTVAAGLSGPGRFRYGGVRDFLLGVRIVSGDGGIVSGGGNVVKNAAGFDLPKLMAGSQGRFGVLVELSCKVFPRPAAWATCSVELPDLNAALETMERLSLLPLDLTCLDLEPPSRLWIRLAGLPESLPRRIARLQTAAQGIWTVLDEQEDQRIWCDAREFVFFPGGHGLVKIGLAPRWIPALEKALSSLSAPVLRRYSVGGNVAWLAWPPEMPARCLDQILNAMGLSAVPLTGVWPDTILGRRLGQPFAERLLQVFDPQHKFGRGTSL